MKLANAFAVAALLLLLLGAADPPPTMEEIQQSFDSGQYQDVVKKVASVLAVKGDPGSTYDKAKILSLKAEAHVRLKQFGMASDSFAMAAKETIDDTLSSTYRATALLMKRSQTGKYQPKQPATQPAGAKGKAEPIDVVEPASRKEALGALFNDESKTVLGKVDSFKRQQSLRPVMDAIKQVSELRAIELAATDATAVSKGALTTLGEHANRLMDAAIKQMSANVEKLATQANETRVEQRHNNNGTIDTITRKRGLISTEKSMLQDVVGTCKNIEQACDELTTALGSDGTVFSGSRQSAATLEARADQVLKANYEPVIEQGSSVVTPRSPRNPPSR